MRPLVVDQLDSRVALGEDFAVQNGADDLTLADADRADDVRGCAERSLAATGVKVAWREDWLSRPAGEMRRRRRGGLLRPVGRVVGRAASAGWGQVTNHFPIGHLHAKGILEPATGRYMIDFGSFAQIHDGQRTFGGRSGRPLATLSPFPTPGGSADMLWVLRVLLGTTEARAEGHDELHGTPCTRLSVRVDLAIASRDVAGGLRSPGVDDFEQLRSLPGRVWIDAEHIRRVQFPDVESRELSLELWDFGVATDDFNWTRLPTFRSPDEAAHYSGQKESWPAKLRTRIQR